MSYKLVLHKLTQNNPDQDTVLAHAMFQVLVNFIELEKGYSPHSVHEIRTWVYDGISPTPHPFEIAYAQATRFSRFFYKKRWRKLLAQAYLHHEIKALSGPDATPEELAYCNMITLQQELYMWFLTEYLKKDTSIEELDEKLRQLLSIRHTLWT